jgi:hypothetical protein
MEKQTDDPIEQFVRLIRAADVPLERFDPYEPVFRSRTSLLRFARIDFFKSSVDRGPIFVPETNVDGAAHTRYLSNSEPRLFFDARGDAVWDYGDNFRFNFQTNLSMFKKFHYKAITFFTFDVTAPDDRRFLTWRATGGGHSSRNEQIIFNLTRRRPIIDELSPVHTRAASIAPNWENPRASFAVSPADNIRVLMGHELDLTRVEEGLFRWRSFAHYSCRVYFKTDALAPVEDDPAGESIPVPRLAEWCEGEPEGGYPEAR